MLVAITGAGVFVVVVVALSAEAGNVVRRRCRASIALPLDSPCSLVQFLAILLCPVTFAAAGVHPAPRFATQHVTGSPVGDRVPLQTKVEPVGSGEVGSGGMIGPQAGRRNSSTGRFGAGGPSSSPQRRVSGGGSSSAIKPGAVSNGTVMPSSSASGALNGASMHGITSITVSRRLSAVSMPVVSSEGVRQGSTSIAHEAGLSHAKAPSKADGLGGRRASHADPRKQRDHASKADSE
jgi:hypothetical protein